MKKIQQKITQFNNAIALNVVMAVSTMACVWTFFLWSLVPLFWPSSYMLVAYISANILQLVLLPLILVGQKLSSNRSSANHQKTASRQDQLEHIITDVHVLLKDQDHQDSVLAKVLVKLESIETRLNQMEHKNPTQLN